MLFRDSAWEETVWKAGSHAENVLTQKSGTDTYNHPTYSPSKLITPKQTWKTLIMSIYYLPEAEMPLTPKGYCDIWIGSSQSSIPSMQAEMPLTPKGYCDCCSEVRCLCSFDWAEMPLTPKGYCDNVHSAVCVDGSEFDGRNAPNAERLLWPAGVFWLFGLYV